MGNGVTGWQVLDEKKNLSDYHLIEYELSINTQTKPSVPKRPLRLKVRYASAVRKSLMNLL